MSRIVVVCEDEPHAAGYLAALRAAGTASADLLLFTPDDHPDDCGPAAAAAAGVLLCGGPDIDPRRYGEVAAPEHRVTVDPELDRIDLQALEGARAARVPVLAICRGLQVLNVFCGGSLWQDLPAQRPGPLGHDSRALEQRPPKDFLAHPVTVTDVAGGTELAALLGAQPVAVNSRHHQGIKRLGDGLVAVATAPDDLVEAVVGTDPTWWVEAVQWHPENLLAHAVHRRIFERFVAATEAAARHLAGVADGAGGAGFAGAATPRGGGGR